MTTSLFPLINDFFLLLLSFPIFLPLLLSLLVIVFIITSTSYWTLEFGIYNSTTTTSLFILVYQFLFSFSIYYITSLFLIQVFWSLLSLLQNDNIIQYLINSLKISKKQLQININKDNKKKLWDQLVANI